MKTKSSVKRIDRGLKKLTAAFKKLHNDKLHVKAGVLGDSEKREGTLTNGQLGLIHEFGTSTIPPRPFIRPAFEKHKAEYFKILQTLVAKKAYRGGADYARVLGIVGTKIAADMKKFVTTGPEIAPENAPSTKRRKEGLRARGNKASTRTLIDTGRMVASITHAVVSNDTIAGKGSKGVK